MGKTKKRITAAVNALDLPPEIILGVPKISVIPENGAEIQNHRGIIEYTAELIKINTSQGVTEFRGNNLYIKSITDDEVIIEGNVMGFEIK